jgi:predicted DCC family thiol-disulfide oxidoreductase YuxK
MVAYPITIYFDGSCKLCSSEINNLVARDKHGAILLIDCSPVDFDDRGLPANRETMMNMIHARDAAGEWLRGIDVFIAAYRAADLNFISWMLAHRWIKPLAARGYPWVVRNRFRLSRLGLHRVMNWLTPSPQPVNDARSKTAFARSQSCAIEREIGDSNRANCSATKASQSNST